MPPGAGGRVHAEPVREPRGGQCREDGVGGVGEGQRQAEQGSPAAGSHQQCDTGGVAGSDLRQVERNRSGAGAQRSGELLADGAGGGAVQRAGHRDGDRAGAGLSRGDDAQDRTDEPSDERAADADDAATDDDDTRADGSKDDTKS